MSGLRERLNRFKKIGTIPMEKPITSIGTDWERIGAQLETNEWGSFILRRRVYAWDAQHGCYQMGEIAENFRELSSFHGKQAVDYEQLLFFDTETTGLGVGAGNVPFMVGIGFYTERKFIVEQLFIRNPSEELAMLAYLQVKLSAFTHIVSYNGRTFDWPILKNRFVLNRLRLEDEHLLQLDFLYPSRSLWRHTLSSCRLGKVEEERLDFIRKDDVPGSLAPTLYFQYLAEEDVRIVEGVFTHNEHDIVTLASLAIHFSKVLAGQLSLNELTLEELYRLSLWLEKMEKAELSEAVLEQLWNRLLYSSSFPKGAHDYLLRLAACYKKKALHHRSVQLWQCYIEGQSRMIMPSIEPYVELSMYFEHREKDVKQALYYAEEALNKLWQRRSLRRESTNQGVEEQAITKRIERLKKKAEARANHRPNKDAAKTERRTKSSMNKPMYVRESLF